MPKALTDLRSYARTHTIEAFGVLLHAMRDKGASWNSKVTAATYIIDRGWGKAPQVLEGNPENPLQINVTEDARAEALRLYFMKTVEECAPAIEDKRGDEE